MNALKPYIDLTILIVEDEKDAREALKSMIELDLYRDILKKIDANLSSTVLKANLHPFLSQREFDVFIDIPKGIKPTDIASKYKIKPKTIGTRTENVSWIRCR